MPLSRRGFGLIELLVATLLSAVLAMLVGKLLLTSAAGLRDRTERMGLEHSLRVSVGAVRAMLEPVGSDSGSGADLSPAGPSSLIARVIRNQGVVCGAAEDRLMVRAGSWWWRGLRAPVQLRDSLIVASVAGPEQWIVAPLVGNPTNGVCADGAPALVLPTELPPPSLAAVGTGSPLQVFEPVELRVYPSSAATWVGLRLAATGEAIQPLAGPFSSNGPGLTYRDRQGNVAASGPDIVMVTLGLDGLTERAGGLGLSRLDHVGSDSVRLAIAFRGRQ